MASSRVVEPLHVIKDIGWQRGRLASTPHGHHQRIGQFNGAGAFEGVDEQYVSLVKERATLRVSITALRALATLSSVDVDDGAPLDFARQDPYRLGWHLLICSTASPRRTASTSRRRLMNRPQI